MKMKRAKAKQKGFVIVLVLSMIGMLAVLLLGFNYKSRASLLAVDEFRKSQQALNCATAGLNIAIAAIRGAEDISRNNKLAGLFSEETTFPVGDGSCSVNVTEDSGRLNLNLLIDKNGKPNRAGIDQLLRLIDALNRPSEGGQERSCIGYGIVPAIIDWIDNDDNVTCLDFVTRENLGAESDYYARLDHPYQCRNGPLDTTDELLLVKGVTPQVFSRIREYVTVRGDGKVNINAASKTVIESLSEKMDKVLAGVIVDRRKVGPFESIMELRDVPGMTDSVYYSIKDVITVSPTEQHYLVESCGSFERLSRTIAAVMRRDTQTKTVDVLLYKEL